MKKDFSVIALVTMFIAPALFAAGLYPLASGDSISVQQVEPFVYVCLEQKGPFDKMEETIGRLLQEMQAQNIVPAGAMIGIYANSPSQVKPEDLQWEMGFPVTEQSFVQPPLQKKEWNFSLVAVGMHQGPYEKTGETIQKIMDWIAANGYLPAGPVLERYLDMNPDELKPEQLKTEIWIPCQKKSG